MHLHICIKMLSFSLVLSHYYFFKVIWVHLMKEVKAQS